MTTGVNAGFASGSQDEKQWLLGNSFLKQLDRLISEATGCDLYLKALVNSIDSLLSAGTSTNKSNSSLVRKFNLLSANAWLKLQDYERASQVIQKCCQQTQRGDKEELKVYFLAFKMHCQLKDKEEAMTVFQ